jgi:hypothetical protein
MYFDTQNIIAARRCACQGKNSGRTTLSVGAGVVWSRVGTLASPVLEKIASPVLEKLCGGTIHIYIGGVGIESSVGSCSVLQGNKGFMPNNHRVPFHRRIKRSYDKSVASRAAVLTNTNFIPILMSHGIV